MDKTLNVIIIDDEEHARENVRLLLNDHPDFEVIEQYGEDMDCWVEELCQAQKSQP